MFAVLVGSDGAGKSTMIAEARCARPTWTFVSAQPEDLYPLAGLPNFDWALDTHPRDVIPRMRPLTRAGFFVSTLAVEYEYHIEPALTAGGVVLCDSYWYRFAAKERIQNAPGGSVFDAMVGELPVPELVVWLDTPLEVAWERKSGAVTRFETEAGERSMHGFQSFQQRVMAQVAEFVSDVPQVHVDGVGDANSIAQSCLAAVEARLSLTPQEV